MADAFVSAFEAAGGEITVNISHEDGKADYSSEVGTLASAGGDILVVAGYLDQGGRGIIEGSIDTGAWDRFVLPGGMIGDNGVDNKTLIEVNAEIRNHTVELVGEELRGYMTEMKSIV